MDDDRMFLEDTARHWWVFLLGGIAWLLIAWVVLRADATSIVAVGVLLGVVFLFAGINEFGLAGLSAGGWKVWHVVMGVIFLIGAFWGFFRPVNTFFALASVLGLILILYGTFEIIQALMTREANPLWWLGLIAGILLILLAFWVSESDRAFAVTAARRTYLILFWVGFMALFKGITQIVVAFGLRHAGKAAAAAPPAVA
jgi:uncharacterized membrane protein HdeD (DUF308 family)